MSNDQNVLTLTRVMFGERKETVNSPDPSSIRTGDSKVTDPSTDHFDHRIRIKNSSEMRAIVFIPVFSPSFDQRGDKTRTNGDREESVRKGVRRVC